MVYSPKNSGFALVAVLSIMLLVVLLTVAMLSLTSSATRSQADGKARAEAEANAKLALKLAIGDLQKHSGLDTRITANADLLVSGAPPLTGVWKSWEGTNHDSSGRPIQPDYGVKTQDATSSSSRFLGFLVSGAESETNPASSNLSSLVTTTAGNNTIPLLSEGSLGPNPGQVHVLPQAFDGGSGHYAWWVSPENQKARLAQPYETRANDAGGWVTMGQSHSVADPEVFGLGSLINDREGFVPDPGNPKPATKALTLETTELLDSSNTAKPHLRFHDLSTSAVGLLTNTATGGWRKDMSILTEKWDDIYARYSGGRLPLFRFSPEEGNTSQVPKPTVSSYDPPQSNLYPWSEYSVIIGDRLPATYHASSASWQSLQDFATSYKNFTYNSGEVVSPFVWDKIAKQRSNQVTDSEMYNYKHKQRLHAQIARFQFLIYARAVDDPNQDDPTKYELWLKYVPIFTLWNPYNVTLELTVSGTTNGGQGSGTHENFRGFGFRRSLPGVMAIERQSTYPNPDAIPDGRHRLVTNGNFQYLDVGGNWSGEYDTFLPRNTERFGRNSKWLDARTWGCWLPEGTLTFGPGEAKVISPDYIDPGYGFGGTAMRMKEGYNPTNIVGPEFRIARNQPANLSYWFTFRPDRVTQPYRGREPGLGFSLSFGDGGSHFGGTSVHPSGIGSEYHNITALATEDQGSVYWPPDEVDEIGYSVGELAGPWVPLFSISFGPRTTIGTGPGTKQNRPTKGMVQNDALAAMVLSEPESGDAKDHPANNTFDFAFHSLTFGSNITPNLSNSEGYIGTGYQSGDGLSRLILADLPLRPMASLVELQGWNPRGKNPYPPFQMNLIGNSDATPLIPGDDVVPPEFKPPGVQYSLQFDDAYCANHLLFDDWFLSSIAPQPRVLGGDIAKDIETFYGDVLTKEDRLSNRAYRLIDADPNMSSSDVAAKVDEILNSAEGWLKIASLIEVDGMFNVNSTSVEAWKAMLGHARSLEEVAIFGEDGIQGADPANEHPVTRGAAAPDVEAGNNPAFSGSFANASEYTGFRSLTDAQIEDLAEKIVEQVRLRGPFLSLAEFVNRQLSSNDDLALAGAVQTAINNLNDDPMEELRDPANMLSDTVIPVSDPKLDGVDYKYEQAAEGDSAYGAPAWIRQADVLRPIAPVLTTRDDTFTIRAYGDSVDENGDVVARAWCEAVVRRTRNFCDPSDAADSTEPPASPINNKFGRKYEIVSFRWLNPNEV